MIVVHDASKKKNMICTYVQSAHVFESIFMKAQSINKILVSEKPDHALCLIETDTMSG